MDVLGDAAERYRRDRLAGLTGGIDLFGTAGQRELGLGQLDLEGKQLDLDIVGAALAAMGRDVEFTGEAANKKLARNLLSLSGLDQETIEELMRSFH
jgi:hypothetical protein